jgi:hypothetical protein
MIFWLLAKHSQIRQESCLQISGCSIIRLVVDPGQGKAEVRLESFLEQFEIPPKTTERSRVEEN